jgi:outer membrane lipoprotein LolB
MRLPSNDSLLRRIVALLFAALLLGGCAALPGSPDAAPASRDRLGDFAIEGRFSLRYDDKNYSGRLSWRHAAAGNELLLASPFGQGIAQITTSDSGALLTTSDGKSYAAADSEQLTRKLLGYPLPLEQLTDWVRGRSGAGVFVLDAQGRPLRIEDDGWRIDYEYDSQEAQALPGRLFAQRDDGIELRLRIDEWTVLTTALPPAEGRP